MAGKRGFPGPYVNEVRRDPMMVYQGGAEHAVMDIGMRRSNSANAEVAKSAEGMNLVHVGDTAGKSRR